MPWSDLAVLLGIAIATPWWLGRLRRWRRPGCSSSACRLKLGAGSAGGRGRAVRALLVVLGLAAPLIPVHGFFAVPLTVLGSVALVLVLWRGLPVEQGPPMASQSP